MKCPYCKKSIGLFATKAVAGETGVKDACPHCAKRFVLGYSRAVQILISLPLALVVFNMTSGALMHALGVGLAFAIAMALAVRAEPLKEEPAAADAQTPPA